MQSCGKRKLRVPWWSNPRRETFWGGYSGYFQDPDKHLWEIVWNPQLMPQEAP